MAICYILYQYTIYYILYAIYSIYYIGDIAVDHHCRAVVIPLLCMVYYAYITPILNLTQICSTCSLALALGLASYS